jgi:hypothetical protein
MTSSMQDSCEERASRRVDPRTGLPLPDPFPEYVPCPHCGEAEVEVWCYQRRVRCHRCGAWVVHTPASCRGTSPLCQAYAAQEDADTPE